MATGDLWENVHPCSSPYLCLSNRTFLQQKAGGVTAGPLVRFEHRLKEDTVEERRAKNGGQR